MTPIETFLRGQGITELVAMKLKNDMHTYGHDELGGVAAISEPMTFHSHPHRPWAFVTFLSGIAFLCIALLLLLQDIRAKNFWIIIACIICVSIILLVVAIYYFIGLKISLGYTQIIVYGMGENETINVTDIAEIKIVRASKHATLYLKILYGDVHPAVIHFIDGRGKLILMVWTPEDVDVQTFNNISSWAEKISGTSNIRLIEKTAGLLSRWM